MKAYPLLILFLIPGCFSVHAQPENSPDNSCQLLKKLLAQARIYEENNNYKGALDKLNSARIAARNCDDKSLTLVDGRIDNVYLKIIDLKTKAEVASAAALRATRVALKASAEANLAKQVAEFERNKAQLAAQEAKLSAAEALEAKRKADMAAQKADSSARTTEASRLTTLALQVKEDDPTLAIQLIKKGCDTSYFNYKEAVKTLQSILLTTHPTSFYLNKVEKGNLDSSNVSSVALSDNGQYLIVGSFSGSIDSWDIAKKAELVPGEPAAHVAGHTGAVLSLATSADGRVIVSGDTEGAIHLWNNRLEKQAISLAGHKGAVISMAVSADRRFLVSSGEDKLINVWDLTSSTLVKNLPLPDGNGMQVCFSPDGRCIGIAGNDETVRVWDWQRDSVVALLEGHVGAVRSVAFSPDGNYVVSGGDDKTVKVWDWKKSRIIHTLQGHQGSVSSVSFPADTAYVVSASQDNTIKVWDLQTSRVYRELRGHQKAIFAAGFFENGRYVYSGSYDRTVKLWDWKQNYILNPPTRKIPQQDNLSATNNPVDIKKVFSQSDTTLFSQYIVTQGADNTIWLWDSTHIAKPVYIIYNGENSESLLPLFTDSSTIKSPGLYQAFYQKLIRINGKLIPAMTHADRSRFFKTSQ